jgi:hypothetical protein
MRAQIIVVVVVAACLLGAATVGAGAAPARRPAPTPLCVAGVCDFGRWNGVVMCESGGSVDATGPFGERGLFQFRRSTWDAVATHRGATRLVGADPASVPPRVQWRQARYLAWRMPGGGLGHWACGWRWGDGTPPVVLRQ